LVRHRDVACPQVRPQDHVVVIQMLHDSLTIKIVSVDEYGRGIASVQPQSLKDMIEARSRLLEILGVRV